MDRPLRYRSRLRVRDQGTRLGEVVFEKRESSTASPEGFVDAYDMTFVSCAGCAAVLHGPDEAGGACSLCRQLLCRTCCERRCAIDGRIICYAHATRARDHTTCRTHGFWEVMTFRFSTPVQSRPAGGHDESRRA